MTSRANRAGGSVSVILKKYIFFDFLNIILDIIISIWIFCLEKKK